MTRPRRKGDFLRIGSDKIETSVRTYAKGAQTVYLVNMIHYGEFPYYQRVAKELRRADVVLYELVYGELVGSPGRLLNLPYTSVRVAFGHMTNWAFCRQTRLVRQIDFLRPKPDWVHADVTADELVKKRFGNEYALFAVQVMDTPFWGIAIALYPVTLTLGYIDECVTTLCSSHEHYNMLRRRALAHALSRKTRKTKLYKIIVTWRSNKAFETFTKQARRTSDASIAIVYGAGHGQDFHAALKRAGYQLTDTKWLTAMHLSTERERAGGDDE